MTRTAEHSLPRRNLPPVGTPAREPTATTHYGSRTRARSARVMLLGLDWPQTGYVVAALHDAGLHTTLVSPAAVDRLGLGRYCEQVRSPAHTSAEYLPFLHEQIERVRPDLLVALSEPLIQLLWSLDPPPAPIYPPTDAWQRRIVSDRRALYEFAANAGVAVAPWMTLHGPADIDRAAQRLGFPLVVRGTAGFAGQQVRIAASTDEAHAALEALTAISPDTPFAQTFLEGERQLFGGVFLRGQTLRTYGQVTVTSWPHTTSPSIRVRTVRDMTMEAYTRELMQRLRWTGIACAEYIRRSDGERVLLELNVRPWAALGPTERSGAGICDAFAQMLAGRTVTARSRYRTDLDAVVLHGFVAAHRRGSMWRTCRALSLRDLYRCLRAVPWGRPALALHMLRSVYRMCD